jgi:glyoxylase-like metal-dependent hydrolase (beta-lactamase superfamily II)
MHFDHAGGSTKFDESGKAIPAFENAEFWVHRGEWHDALNPTPKSKASYLKENLLPLEESGRLVLFDGDCTEVLPGLTLRTSGGHTRHHQILVLDQAEGGFIYWGDLIPTSHHLKVPYVMAYDLYPVESMARKAVLLKEAYAKNWLCFFEHDLDVPACRLAYNEEKDFYTAVDAVSPGGAKSAVSH